MVVPLLLGRRLRGSEAEHAASSVEHRLADPLVALEATLDDVAGLVAQSVVLLELAAQGRLLAHEAAGAPHLARVAQAAVHRARRAPVLVLGDDLGPAGLAVAVRRRASLKGRIRHRERVWGESSSTAIWRVLKSPGVVSFPCRRAHAVDVIPVVAGALELDATQLDERLVPSTTPRPASCVRLEAGAATSCAPCSRSRCVRSCVSTIVKESLTAGPTDTRGHVPSHGDSGCFAQPCGDEPIRCPARRQRWPAAVRFRLGRVDELKRRGQPVILAEQPTSGAQIP